MKIEKKKILNAIKGLEEIVDDYCESVNGECCNCVFDSKGHGCGSLLNQLKPVKRKLEK